MHRLSHHDTGYHSPSPVSPADDSSHLAYSNRPVDDIPLQDHAQRMPGKDAEMQDHVYDAAGGGSGRKQRKARVRFGELGMLGSGRKKIPLVVYFFTIVQVAVFIGEIVKNGRHPTSHHPKLNHHLLTLPPPSQQQQQPAPPS